MQNHLDLPTPGFYSYLLTLISTVFIFSDSLLLRFSVWFLLPFLQSYFNGLCHL